MTRDMSAQEIIDAAYLNFTPDCKLSEILYAMQRLGQYDEHSDITKVNRKLQEIRDILDALKKGDRENGYIRHCRQASGLESV